MARPTFAPDHPVAPFGTALINETVPSGGGLSVDNTVLFLGEPSTKVNIPINLGSPTFEVGTSTASFNPGSEAEQAFARTKVFAVKTDGANTITGARLSVGNGALTVGYQFNRRNLYTDTHDGWTIFVREPGADAVAGSPDLSGNVRTRLALTASGNIVAGDVWIGFAGVLEAQPPTVVLTFDDGYAEWTWLAGELASRGLPASFGIAYGDVGKAGYLTASEVQAIGNHASGLFEITNHAEGNDSLSDLGQTDYLAAVEACRSYLTGLGLPEYPAKLHAYVQGVFSEALIGELQSLGYHSARAVETPGQVANHVSIAFDGAGSNALYAIPATAYLNSSHTVAQVKAQIELAAPGGTVFVVGHRFGDTANSTAWIDGYDTDHGILDLLDWLEDKRDNDGWTIQNWSTWHKEITGAGEAIEAGTAGAIASALPVAITQMTVILARAGEASAHQGEFEALAAEAVFCEIGGAASIGHAAVVSSAQTVSASVGQAEARALGAAVELTTNVDAATGAAGAAGQPAVLAVTQSVDAGVAPAHASGLPAAVDQIESETVVVAAAVGEAVAHAGEFEQRGSSVVFCDAGTSVAAGLRAGISRTTAVVASAGRAVARGVSAAMSQAGVVAADVGRAVARGRRAAISAGGGVAAWTGAAIARGMPASVAIRESFAAGVGAALAGGRTAAVSTGIAISAGAGAAVAAGLPAQVGTAGVVECGIGAVVARAAPAVVTSQRQVGTETGRALAAGMHATVSLIGAPIGPFSASVIPSVRGATVTRIL